MYKLKFLQDIDESTSQSRLRIPLAGIADADVGGPQAALGAPNELECVARERAPAIKRDNQRVAL